MIYALPDALEELFVLAHHVYEDTRTDLKPKLQAQHLEVSKMVQVLAGVPEGSFQSIPGAFPMHNPNNGSNNNSGSKIDVNASGIPTNATGASGHQVAPSPPDVALSDTLHQIEHLWRTELYRVNQSSMAWRTPLIRLAQEASELLMYTKVRFPASRRLLRQLSTSQSFATISMLACFVTIIFGMCVAVITIPSVQASALTGVTVGIVLSVLLIIVSAMMMWSYHNTMIALDALFERLFFERVVALKLGRDDDNQQRPTIMGGGSVGGQSNALSDGGAGGGAAGRRAQQVGPSVRPSMKKHTKTGFYTISYDGGIGWIDGQFLDTQVVMIGFDEQYCITLWNNAAETTTGFLETECLGKPLSELVDSPSGDIKQDIQSMKKTSRSQQSAALKIRLRAFATAPVTLFTIVAPISGETNPGNALGSSGQVGNILICANAKDNLKEARGFLHDYHIHRIQDVADELVQQGSLGHEETVQMKILAKFANLGYAKALEDAARTMVYEWEWTTGNQLFARALGTWLNRCTLVLSPSFPQTLCVNPFIAGTIGNAMGVAVKGSNRCEVRASVAYCNIHHVHQLEVSLTVPASSKPFDPEEMLEGLKSTMNVTLAYISFSNDDTTTTLQFPCQVAMLVEDFGENGPAADGEGGNGGANGEPVVKCSVNVITLLSNTVDRHNLSMVLLKTIYISLTNVQDPRDLEKKIAGQEVDVIIADRTWFSTAKMLVQNHRAQGSVILIPLTPTGEDDAAIGNDAMPHPRVTEFDEDEMNEDDFSPVAVVQTAVGAIDIETSMRRRMSSLATTQLPQATPPPMPQTQDQPLTQPRPMEFFFWNDAMPHPRVTEFDEDEMNEDDFSPVAVIQTAVGAIDIEASMHRRMSSLATTQLPQPIPPPMPQTQDQPLTQPRPMEPNRTASPAPATSSAAVPPANASGMYVIKSPIQRNILEALMLEVAKEVEKKKAAIAERDEREKILTLRQDSPWTQGRLLGRGAFGAVYEAMSDLTGGKMAVKMFYFRSQGEEGSINELLNEIKIMCSLNHPNIVHYFYCERKDNNVNLFMELCDQSLAEHMMNKVVPKRGGGSGLMLTAPSVLKQVVSAVAYLHGKSIAHRDIKPQNILLKEDKIKLTDFGTSRQTGADEEMLDTQGTFRYMAPEVYRGESHSLSCDIWSIGCLACELFLCPPKFMENRFSSLLGTMEEVELPNVAVGVLQNFLEQCLQLNPQLRPSAQMLLLHPLLTDSHAVEGLPTVFDVKGPRHSIAANVRQSAFSMSSNNSETMSQTGIMQK
ncbi:protein kinase, putative [Bodo saltans]|uniref:Protein kinase, putative n=1 Tax=Bodo saltans TaxID=75058 RepID=A0A0S4IKM7_BODSA|nr:protein kinase, putative [Bodo saltans]|eukprot:CUE67314.1 protein kinase, putative [Bodo saltans]